MRKIACVVLATLNEAGNIRVLLPLIFDQACFLRTHELHVLVVDDDSPDGTGDVVNQMKQTHSQLHLLTGGSNGLGKAYQRGIAHALDTLHADLVIIMDADFQHDPALLPHFVELADSGYDFVIGSRFVPGGSTPNFPLFRRMISLSGTRLVRWFGKLPRVQDCTSEYRCIRASVLARCSLTNLTSRGYSFNSALLIELIRQGARYVEVPIVFAARKEGRSKLAFRDKVEFLFLLGRLWWRSKESSGGGDHRKP